MVVIDLTTLLHLNFCAKTPTLPYLFTEFAMRRGILPHKQDWMHVLLCLLLTPLLYCYEVFYILPTLYPESTTFYYIHIVNSIFLLHNVAGNWANGARGGGTVMGKVLPPAEAESRLCEVCSCVSPPRAWHCGVCDVCVLKRDHHCNFFGCCVGYLNHRYFLMFVFHVFVSTLYAFYFNLTFMIYHMPWNLLSWLSCTKFLFPLAAVAFDSSMDSVNALFFITNIIVTGFTGFLLFYHGRVILRGQITPESKRRNSVSYDKGWKSNLMDVLGERWYIAWVSPFLVSKLPGDGMHWQAQEVVKTE